jgi:4-amino-4-deoxy-L-arabinose transferase-like glycosyltransferase
MLGAVALFRSAYTVLQSRVDPWYAFPVLDGRYYVEWATAIARGGSGPDGAYYLAPLYPVLLSIPLRVSELTFGVLYLGQQVLGLLTAALLAIGGRRVVGDRAALGAACLFLLYPPLTFFAARPLGETVAIFLLTAALVCAWRSGSGAGLAAGLLLGLASLARPNLLLVLPVWGLIALRRRAWLRAFALLAGFAIVVLPVTVRNRVVSGHWVLISSNGGLTAYHGNGPEAKGVFADPGGFSGDVAAQREDATRRARALSGRPLDAVEADAWWGRRALATRIERPLETVGLLAWRLALTLDNKEWGLDYPPSLDPNPLRLTVRWPPGAELSFVPWALLIGLSGAAVVGRGWRGSGGPVLWSAVVATVATPVLFYVSTRYRLPTSALLTVPAGAGAVSLLERGLETAVRRRAAIVGVVLAVISLSVPSGGLHRLQLAEDLGNRALAYLQQPDPSRALADAERAVELLPDSARLWSVLGRTRLAREEYPAAEQAFRRSLGLGAGARSSAGLAAALAGQGRIAAALEVLRRALVLAPDDPSCWNRIIALLYATGDEAGARAAARRAAGAGVRLEPEVRAMLDGWEGPEP